MKEKRKEAEGSMHVGVGSRTADAVGRGRCRGGKKGKRKKKTRKEKEGRGGKPVERGRERGHAHDDSTLPGSPPHLPTPSPRCSAVDVSISLPSVVPAHRSARRLLSIRLSPLADLCRRRGVC